MKEKKIGFLQRFNKSANMIEFSLTSLQMIIFTFFAMFFIYQYFITEDNDVTVNSIFLIIVVLIGAFAPKAMKDFTSLKDKIN